KAVLDLYKKYQLILDYSLPIGLYGKLVELNNNTEKIFPLTVSDIEKIKERMSQIIKANFPIIKTKMNNDEAVALFNSHGQLDKAGLFKNLGKFFIPVYFLDGYGDTFYGPQLYSTGAIDKFDLIKYNDGFCLQSPSAQPPFNIAAAKYQEKLSDVFKENSDWCNIIGVKDIVTVNKAITNGYASKVIQIAEALHERKYAAIADKIHEIKGRVKLVLIAGPSSSGKTTTSKRIALQLKVLGLNPVVIAMDNYFLNRDDTPKDANGNYDFECLEAMDLSFLNKQLNQLFNGEEVELPKFNFTLGKRYFDGTKIRLNPNDVLIMEGIHALNPNLTLEIDNEIKYKIYVSALTSLSIDENNYISTTDGRLLRRMVRDNNFRGTSAEQTILRWQSVMDGEYKNIFPYQENADIMFNSSLIYELPMLKHYADPLLRRIPPLSTAYAESLRLLKFLSYIIELNPKEQAGIPPTSVMREFIGGSTLKY
ncbi:MAG: nucleoside kinase, partial [Bacteroidales bacterium]